MAEVGNVVLSQIEELQLIVQAVIEVQEVVLSKVEVS